MTLGGLSWRCLVLLVVVGLALSVDCLLSLILRLHLLCCSGQCRRQGLLLGGSVLSSNLLLLQSGASDVLIVASGLAFDVSANSFVCEQLTIHGMPIHGERPRQKKDFSADAHFEWGYVA